ncbi:c-type cytochrome [Marinobacterium mangrovicola]|uniref:Cbb3-type cytochrome c oxidase subunit III n=1 Tax=Marinobacterium mangrovicola TaxID=1476959 RepID=A0A4R1GEY6_9GAMM|nr:c-type cytochrome [Marinobacterium mangrovicola]TCK06887.1 cbb3-type cytochrome c oxidase subunit III [Marinobacterium mangrovicola]
MVARHFVLIPGLLILAACDSKDPTRLSQGDELYEYYCAGCHEERGLGRHLEKLPLNQRKMQEYEIVLMLTQDYSGEHPTFSLPQLSNAQADAIAGYTYALPGSADN